jgi:hypothetical protein
MRTEKCMNCNFERRDWKYYSELKDRVYSYYCKLTGLPTGSLKGESFIEFEDIPVWCPLNKPDDERVKFIIERLNQIELEELVKDLDFLENEFDYLESNVKVMRESFKILRDKYNLK